MTIPSTTSSTVPAGSIIVAVDGSHHGDDAVLWAADEAHARQRPLTAVHVEKVIGAQERGWLASAGIPLNQVADEIRADSKLITQDARKLATRRRPELEVHAMVCVGDARTALLDLATNAPLLVLGSRGRGQAASLLLGSVSVSVSRRSPSPVVVVRPRDSSPVNHGVLVGTTASAVSMPTLEAAFREASYRALPLTVVHCLWDAPGARIAWRPVRPMDPEYEAARNPMTELLSDLRQKFDDVEVDVQITRGQADQCIADLSRTHELTVVGRHTHTLLGRVGAMSYTTSIIEHASGPVLVVP